MNAIDMLKEEHQGAKKAMNEVASSSGPARKQLFTALKAELEMHDRIEETVFYPALKSHPQASGLQGADKAAHEAVEKELAKLAMLSVEDASWLPDFKAMQSKLLKHIEDEETNIFVKVKSVLTANELSDLGSKMKASKAEKMKLAGSKS